MAIKADSNSSQPIVSDDLGERLLADSIREGTSRHYLRACLGLADFVIANRIRFTSDSDKDLAILRYLGHLFYERNLSSTAGSCVLNGLCTSTHTSSRVYPSRGEGSWLGSDGGSEAKGNPNPTRS